MSTKVFNQLDWTAAHLPARLERLSNGLTVVTQTDSKSPLVAIYLGYRAGSREEPKSKAGLAHLCEHLMFCGTKANPGSYFAPFEQAGASWMNAFVREDYSAYFATLPSATLDFAMSMEADRMANLAEALDDDTFERQRDVVINELRQREGELFGCTARILAELLYPPTHPYAHPPDGLISELSNISIDDARTWIQQRHCPTTATLIVVGDADAGQVVEKAEHHFGSLKPNSTVSTLNSWPIGPAPASRRRIEIPAKHGKLCMAWNAPGFASPQQPAFETAAEILAGAKGSRLWQQIVQIEQLASEVGIELRPRELGVSIVLSVVARTGVPLSAIEARVRSTIERLSADGPEADELDSARVRIFGKMVRGFERVGGPRSKSDALGIATIVGGTPESHQRRLSALAALQPGAAAGASGSLASTGAVLEMRPVTEANGR
jgi:zinc protease